jgi:putative alpha-1,2-mannosidase
MQTEYDATPDGLSGNDDAGQMSAWYIFSAMGFYPVSPGTREYVIGSPSFDRVTIHLEQPYYEGKSFTIIANNVSEENRYIQSVKLNGKPWRRPWFDHSVIVAGGVLEFEMGSLPNKEWGSGPEDAPFSLSSRK